MCFSTTKNQKQRTAIRISDKSTMALPSLMNAWPSFGGQGTSPHLSTLQSAHQLTVWNPVSNSGTNLHSVHNTAHVHTSSTVQPLESPADSQSPGTPAKAPVPEESTPLTPSLKNEVPNTPTSFPAETGVPIMNGTTLLYPSSLPSGVPKKQKRTRRKRCLECEGCQRKDNCGVCSVCTNPNATNTVCKKRRCELLKSRPPTTTAPVVSTPMSSPAVMMMESPKRELSQTPPVTIHPGMNGFSFPSSVASSPIKDELIDFKPPIARKRKRNGSQVYRPPQKEPPPCGCVGSEEGIYYTHLGTASSPEELRQVMEKRFSVTGNQLRLLEITFTGYEAKTSEGCPTAEWVIRRSAKEELFLVVYRFHKGHTCNAPYTVVSIVLWEGLSQARSLQLYQQLTDVLPKYGCPTPRKCEKNETKSCLCQGKDEETRGYSYSFGCSWSVYYNGCKFARSKVPRKFRLTEQSQEEALENTFQSLATDLAPVYKWLAPESFQNQANTQNLGHECRLGFGEERPFSGVTCCMDFCAHSHYDRHNMSTGGATVVCTILRKGVLKDDPEDSEQIHVLPLYRLKNPPEKSSPGIEVRPVESDVRYDVSHLSRSNSSMANHEQAMQGQVKPASSESPAQDAPAQSNSSAVPSSVSTSAAASMETQHPATTNQSIVDGNVNRTSSVTTSTCLNTAASIPHHPTATTTQTVAATQNGRPPLPSALAEPGSTTPLHTSTPAPISSSTPKSDVPPNLINLVQQGSNGFHPRPNLNGLTSVNGFAHLLPKVMKQELNGHASSPVLNRYTRSPQLHDLSGGNTSSTDSDSDCYILTDSPTPSHPSNTPPRPPPPPGTSRPYTPDVLQHHHHILKAEFTAAGLHIENGRSQNGFLPHRPPPPPYLSFKPPPAQFSVTHQLQRSQSFTSSPGHEDSRVLLKDNSLLSTPSNVGKVSPSPLAMESYPSMEDKTDGTLTETDDTPDFVVSDRVNASPGGVGIALGHGSILIECAKKELHATTPIKNPCRTMPTRISMVFYQHKNLLRRQHGWYEEEEKARKRQEEQQRLKMLRTQEELFTGRVVHFNPPSMSPCTPHHLSVGYSVMSRTLEPTRGAEFDEGVETSSDCEYSDVFEPFYPNLENNANVVVGKVPRAVPFSQIDDSFHVELPIKQEETNAHLQHLNIPPPLNLPCRYVSSPVINTTTLTTSACKPKDVMSGSWTKWVEC